MELINGRGRFFLTMVCELLPFYQLVSVMYINTKTGLQLRNSFLCSPTYFMRLGSLQMKAQVSFNHLLKKRGYSDTAINKLWKWYDYSEFKGVASF